MQAVHVDYFFFVFKSSSMVCSIFFTEQIVASFVKSLMLLRYCMRQRSSMTARCTCVNEMYICVILALTHKVQSLSVYFQFIMFTDQMFHKHLHGPQTLPLVTVCNKITYMIACRIHIHPHSLHSNSELVCVFSKCCDRFNGILT